MKNLLKTYSKSFYSRNTLDVARDVLGAVLCRRLPDGTVLSGNIVEVEAYTQDDPACHAYRGLTPRSSVLFGPPGMAYVYFIYGMYWCLNVVTEPEGTPGAVLIRAVDAPGCNGPGKLCRQWQISREHNRISLMDTNSDLWISPGRKIADSDVSITPRIGLNVAQERLWRFHVSDHHAVSGSRGKRRTSK